MRKTFGGLGVAIEMAMMRVFMIMAIFAVLIRRAELMSEEGETPVPEALPPSA